MRTIHGQFGLTAILVIGSSSVCERQGWAREFGGPEWSMGGHDLTNSRSNPFERRLGPDNVGSLTTKWIFSTDGDVSATPAVVHGALYFPDWGGSLWKVDARTGSVIWARSIADYVGVAGTVSRSSPAVVGNTVYIGTGLGAYLLAINATTGDLQWRTQIDSHPAAILTQSPIVHDGVVYQGVSSSEEGAAKDPTYPCCTFRGSMNAVNAFTGEVLWHTSMIPDQGGGTDVFSGAPIWSSTPALDPATHTVYVTTGNNYKIPKSAEDCQRNGGDAADCLPPWNRINSIVALDSGTGAIKWSTGEDRFDSWNGSCFAGQPPNNCPAVPGQDLDFGDGAHLFRLRGRRGQSRAAVGAGQKSGEYWMLDATTGEIIWSAVLGPGSFAGGVEWGTATDGVRIYFAETDYLGLPYQLPSGQSVTTSSFGALDPNTGRIIWQNADPHGGYAVGAVSTANGVAYVGALDGHMYAFDGATGAWLWEFLAPGSSVAAPAIVNGSVYWGNGYSRFGTPNSALYAFSAPGR